MSTEKALIYFAIAIFSLFGPACSKKPRYDGVADLALLNGKILTIDENESIAEAVAVKFGKILAVGTRDEIKGLIGQNTRIIDLKGRTAIPGLIDSHCHITSTAMRMIGVLDLSEEAGVRSIADIQRKIAEKVATVNKGEWISGAREDDYKLAEKRHPTRWELDKASPQNPVIISTVGGHFSIANSKAFEHLPVSMIMSATRKSGQFLT